MVLSLKNDTDKNNRDKYIRLIEYNPSKNWPRLWKQNVLARFLPLNALMSRGRDGSSKNRILDCSCPINGIAKTLFRRICLSEWWNTPMNKAKEMLKGDGYLEGCIIRNQKEVTQKPVSKNKFHENSSFCKWLCKNAKEITWYFWIAK